MKQQNSKSNIDSVHNDILNKHSNDLHDLKLVIFNYRMHGEQANYVINDEKFRCIVELRGAFVDITQKNCSARKIVEISFISLDVEFDEIVKMGISIKF